MLQLFAFVKADISAHQVKLQANVSASDESKSTAALEPVYPKSLFLVQPLHARILRPIPSDAAAGTSTSKRETKVIRVPIPEGLNLDAWIVPPPKSAIRLQDEDENAAPSTYMTSGKKKRGKEKTDGSKVKAKSKSKKAKEGANDGDNLGGGDSAEEQAAMTRVSDSYFSPILQSFAKTWLTREKLSWRKRDEMTHSI